MLGSPFKIAATVYTRLVQRPEVSARQARAFSPSHIPLPLPDGHRFPIRKYAALAGHLKALGWQVDPAPEAHWTDIARVHDESYVAKLRRGELESKAVRKLGFPQSADLLKRSRHSVGGTVAALYDALERGYGINLAGGTHHSYPSHGEGFCVFNDHAVAIRRAFAEGLVERVLIVDLDVHQGNGTAVIFADEPRVYTLSVHGARNYPFQKERSDCDLPLPDGTDDARYLETLAAVLPELFERLEPEVVFYVGGVDVLAGDRFGRMALTPSGVVARDRLVFDSSRRAGAALVYTMGGGYQTDIGETVRAHAAGLEALRRTFSHTLF